MALRESCRKQKIEGFIPSVQQQVTLGPERKAWVTRSFQRDFCEQKHGTKVRSNACVYMCCFNVNCATGALSPAQVSNHPERYINGTECERIP